MSRRYAGHMNGERFLANASPSKREVHDLDDEQKGAWQCQVDEIIRAGNDRPFSSLAAASAAGYDHCAYCLDGSTR